MSQVLIFTATFCFDSSQILEELTVSMCVDVCRVDGDRRKLGTVPF